MTSRRKSRRLSCCHHVRLSGEDLQSFGDPLSPGTFRHLKHESHSNLKSLDVRDDETPQANPSPRLTGWGRFVSGVPSFKKPNSLTETLTPWVILSLFGGSEGDEGYWSKDGFWETKMDSRTLGVSPLGLSHRNSGNWKHSFIFGIRKAWFWIPPTHVASHLL
jgi:hypothetical protein